jgi:hypothetical protein
MHISHGLKNVLSKDVLFVKNVNGCEGMEKSVSIVRNINVKK